MKQNLWPIMVMLALIAPCEARNNTRPTPEKIEFFGSFSPPSCGLRADYDHQVLRIRIELELSRASQDFALKLRAYSPGATTPPMRDLWLKTESLFTLGRFKPGAQNSIGVMEVKGVIDQSQADQFVQDILQTGAEFAVIGTGPMPIARVAAGLPPPKGSQGSGEFNSCATSLLNR